MGPHTWSTEDRQRVFDRAYFQGASAFGGYPFYTDLLRSWLPFDKLREMGAASVLELGCANGYVIRHLEDVGVPCKGIDVSPFCYVTRATDSVISWDLTKVPWPIADGEIDVCFSNQVLDEIPEHQLPAVLCEIRRVSKRGIHGLDLRKRYAEIFAPVRTLDEPDRWWAEKLKLAGPNQKVVDAAIFEEGAVKLTYNSGPVKVNFGSWTEMFHHNWINIDKIDLDPFAKQGSFRFLNADVTTRIKSPDNTLTAATAFHLVDQLPPDGLLFFLRECWRVLMPGGVFRLSIPDIPRLQVMATEQRLGFFDPLNDDIKNAKSQEEKLYFLTACGRYRAWAVDEMVSLMRESGFSRIEVMPFRKTRSEHLRVETRDTLPDMSVFIEGNKLTM